MAEPFVCVIGGASMDLAGRSYAAIRPEESNPGSLHISCGGVGRNIAENLARLALPVQMITVLGDDDHGQQLLAHAKSTGIDMHAHIVADGISPCYLSINDPRGELAVAVAAMDLLDQLDVGVLRQHETIIAGAALCVIDTNLNPEVIGFLLQHFPATFFCVDLVSMAKSDKIKPWLKHCSLIKPNRAEAEMLSGIKIREASGLRAAAHYFLAAGVEQLFISLGPDGLFYADGGQSGWLSFHPPVKPVSTNGAGDAMMAGLVYGRFRGLDLETTARTAMAASRVTLAHSHAVNPDINPCLLRQAMETVHHAAMD